MILSDRMWGKGESSGFQMHLGTLCGRLSTSIPKHYLVEYDAIPQRRYGAHSRILVDMPPVMWEGRRLVGFKLWNESAHALENLGYKVRRPREPPKGEIEAGLRRVYAEISRRRGQRAFRAALIEEFGGQCAFSGCRTAEALEAAHIVPFAKKVSHDVSEAFLLRADLHTLFDLHLISVNPKSRRIEVSEAVRSDPLYRSLHQKRIHREFSPGIAIHYSRFIRQNG